MGGKGKVKCKSYIDEACGSGSISAILAIKRAIAHDLD